MSAIRNVAVVLGSLRKPSYCRRMAHALTTLVPPELKLEIVEIGSLPHYDQDFDDAGTSPPEWIAFREHIRQFAAVLFITPEYNRSVPGVLKNAIDVGSRPFGKSAWDGKPAAILSLSPGAMGGFGANHHLRQSLVFLNMPTLQQPEAYIGHAAKLFAEDGSIAIPATREFLETFVARFAAWIARNN